MTKFKVGDNVKVKKNLKVNEYYNGCFFDRSMLTYCGQTLTIVKAFSDKGNDRYSVKETDTWHFSNDMFESIQITSINDLQFGDILTLRNGERYVYAQCYMIGESKNYWCDADEVKDCYNGDLTRKNSIKEYDIMKVERQGEVVYECTDVREMTVEEISSILGYEVKIIKENK